MTNPSLILFDFWYQDNEGSNGNVILQEQDRQLLRPSESHQQTVLPNKVTMIAHW